MARLARVVIPGVAHHVTQRGNRRLPVFFGDADRRLYLELLREGCVGGRCAVWPGTVPDGQSRSPHPRSGTCRWPARRAGRGASTLYAGDQFPRGLARGYGDRCNNPQSLSWRYGRVCVSLRRTIARDQQHQAKIDQYAAEKDAESLNLDIVAHISGS